MSDPLVLSPSLIWVLLVVGPIAFVACTCFAKVSIVLGALRLGLGVEPILPWSVLSVLAILVTLAIMQPVGIDLAAAVSVANREALLAADPRAWADVVTPLLEFCRRHAGQEELATFDRMHEGAAQAWSAIPAFMATELREGLIMGAYVLIPFLVVELMVGQVLTAAGWSAPAPSTWTIPIKIGLFLAIGGWTRVISGLAAGYA